MSEVICSKCHCTRYETDHEGVCLYCLQAERDALAARVAELEAKLSRVCDWAAGLCISHPHLVPHDIAHVEREGADGDE